MLERLAAATEGRGDVGSVGETKRPPVGDDFRGAVAEREDCGTAGEDAAAKRTML